MYMVIIVLVSSNSYSYFVFLVGYHAQCVLNLFFVSVCFCDVIVSKLQALQVLKCS